MSIRETCKLFFFAGLMLAVCGCGRPNIIGTDAAVYSRGNLFAVSGHDLNSVYAQSPMAGPLQYGWNQGLTKAPILVLRQAASATRKGHVLFTKRYRKTLRVVQSRAASKSGGWITF